MNPTPPTRPKAKRRTTSRSVRIIDRLTTGIITVGGLFVILAVFGILLYLFAVVIPLFRGSSSADPVALKLAPSTSPLLFAEIDEYRSLLLALRQDGSASLLESRRGETVPLQDFDLIVPAPIRSWSRPLQGGGLCLGLEDGSVVSGKLSFEADFPSEAELPSGFVATAGQQTVVPGGILETTPEGLVRRVRPRLALEPPVALAAADPVVLLDCRRTEQRESVASLSVSGRLAVSTITSKQNFATGEIQRRARSKAVEEVITEVPAFLLLTTQADQLYVAWTDGRLWRYDIPTGGTPKLAEQVDLLPEPEAKLTSLGFPIGEQSLIAADSLGRVRVWMRLPLADQPANLAGPGGSDGFGLARAHDLEPQPAGIAKVAYSMRDKSFATLDSKGGLWLRHLTSEQTLLKLELPASAPPQSLQIAPKGNAILAFLENGEGWLWSISNPHPETTASSLVTKVWYEGYSGPSHTWQSSSGNDEFEPKLGLMPLIFGTLKATLFAMLFAVPLALGAAIYTSEFLRRDLRNSIKPVIEIMASLPSVVLGFIAALVLAPWIEERVFQVLLSLGFLPLLCLSGGALIQSLPHPWPRRLGGIVQLGLLLALLGLAWSLAGWIAPPLERWWFGGDFTRWLDLNGWTYVQRNTLIVGFAMGFAVIPLVYTIAEDALSSVPEDLRSASLGCGATRWQTAMRVVLPMATSGVFAAVMIGLGRAVGETMIVLMAAGNTPLMDWNPFNGLRALSANIAVELPEAVQGSTLYRVLFLAALVLFVMTFIVNTLAEMIRLRFRRRVARL